MAQSGLRKAAIIVDNRAGDSFDSKVSVLEDFVTSRLSSASFQVINRESVLNSLKTYDPKARPAGGGSDLDQQLSDHTSALRLAQNLGADLVLSVAISSYGKDTKAYSDPSTGVQTLNIMHNLRLSYKLVEAWPGGTVAGDMFKVSKATRTSANLAVDDADLINDLLDEASEKIVRSIRERIGSLPPPSDNPKTVQVTFNTHMSDLIKALQVDEDGKAVVVEKTMDIQLKDVNVEVDGISIGSAPGTLATMPGLHKLRFSREGFKDLEKTANLYDKETLNQSLQMTEAGYNRWKNATQFLQNLHVQQQLTAAEVKVLEGQAQMLRQSGYKVDIDVKASKLPDTTIINR